MKISHEVGNLDELLRKNPRSRDARSDIEEAQDILKSLRQMGLGSESYGLGPAFGDRDWLYGPRRQKEARTDTGK